MGLRGPQPKLKLRSEALDDLSPPDWLGDEGKAYWSENAPQLKANQLLTVQTVHSFAMLCDLWDRYQSFHGADTSRIYLDTVKAYTTLAMKYRLLPTEVPNVKESRFADFAEVELG